MGACLRNVMTEQIFWMIFWSSREHDRSSYVYVCISRERESERERKIDREGERKERERKRDREREGKRGGIYKYV